MNIKEISWHYKIWKWIYTDKKELPSVCSYWSTVFIQFPMICIHMVIFSPLFPIFWIASKIEEKHLPKKKFCPFGQITLIKKDL